MRILIISESINVEDSSGSKVNVALIKNLKKCNFEIRVLHYSHKQISLDGIKTHLIKERKSLNYILSRIIRITQKKLKIQINPTVEKYFGFSFTHTNDSRSITLGIKQHLDFNPDFILTLSKGGSFRPHRAMLFLPELHKKWIAYIHDPYPFHFYPRPFNWVEKSYNHKEKFVNDIFKRSRYLAFPSLLLKEWMQSYFPAAKDKSILIPHQINEKTVNSYTDLPDFIDENNFTLLHAGNLLLQRNPLYLIEGFISFLDKNPETKAKLVFIGNNRNHANVVQKYRNHPNIIFNDYTEYDIVQIIERNVSANIILEAVSEISPFLPGKFPNCVIANRPIISLSPYYSEVKRLLGNDYQYWCEANDVNGIERIISSLYNKWKKEPDSLKLDRNDLIDYCSNVYLEKVINDIK